MRLSCVGVATKGHDGGEGGERGGRGGVSGVRSVVAVCRRALMYSDVNMSTESKYVSSREHEVW